MTESYRVGILRVLTTNDEAALNSHQNVLRRYFPEFDMETRCIPNQPRGLFSKEAHLEAEPFIMRMSEDWEGGIDGLIISCSDDPCVKALKRRLRIPVVGAGEAAATLALLNNLKVGVIGIEAIPPSNITALLGSLMVGYQVPAGVVATTDLMADEAHRFLRESALKLKDCGAEQILLACTGFTTIGAMASLRDIGLPIIDGVIASGIALKGLMLNSSVQRAEHRRE